MLICQYIVAINRVREISYAPLLSIWASTVQFLLLSVANVKTNRVITAVFVQNTFNLIYMTLIFLIFFSTFQTTY